MKGILADINIQSCVDLLVARMRSEPWKIFWDYLRLQYFHFSQLGLAPEALDSLVWETCQRNELVLLTDNRNQADPDSLEATIAIETLLTRYRSLPSRMCPIFEGVETMARK